MINLKPEHQFLLAVLGNTLRTAGKEVQETPETNLDWGDICRLARLHRVGPLLFHACYKRPARYKNIPPDVRQDFQEQYQETYLQNRLLYQHLDLLLPQWAEIQIFPVFLKGIFLAKWVYEHIALRPMQDIDLLLADQDIPKAERVLDNAGYTSILDHLTFVSDWHKAHEEALFAQLKSQGFHSPRLIKSLGAFQVGIELHHTLMPGLHAHNVQTVNSSYNENVIRTLRPEYFLLHLCFHLHSHAIAAKHPLLIWYYDLLRFLNTHSARFDWARLLSLSEQFQVQEIVVTRLVEACRLFDYPVPAPLQFTIDEAGELSEKSLAVLFPEREPTPEQQFMTSAFKLRTFLTGMRYLWACLFPSRQFLRNHYQIRHRWLVYGYYPLRLGKAFGRGMRLIKVLFDDWWNKKTSGF